MAAVDKNNILPKGNEFNLDKISYNENTPISDIAKGYDEVAKPLGRMAQAAAEDVHNRQVKLIGNDFGKVNPMNYAAYYQPSVNDARSSMRIMGAERAFEEGMDRGKKSAEANYNAAKNAYEQSKDAYNNAKEAFSQIKVSELDENLLPPGVTNNDLTVADVFKDKKTAESTLVDLHNKQYQSVDWSDKKIWDSAASKAIQNSGIDTSNFKDADWDKFWSDSRVGADFSHNYIREWLEKNAGAKAVENYDEGYNGFLKLADNVSDFINGVTEKLEIPSFFYDTRHTGSPFAIGFLNKASTFNPNGGVLGEKDVLSISFDDFERDSLSGLSTFINSLGDYKNPDAAKFREGAKKILGTYKKKEEALRKENDSDKKNAIEEAKKGESERADKAVKELEESGVIKDGKVNSDLSLDEVTKSAKEASDKVILDGSISKKYDDKLNSDIRNLREEAYTKIFEEMSKYMTEADIRNIYGQTTVEFKKSMFSQFFNGLEISDLIRIKNWQKENPDEYKSFITQLAMVNGELSSIEIADGERWYYTRDGYKQLPKGTPVFFTYKGALNEDGSIKDPDLKEFIDIWKDYYSADVENISEEELTSKTQAFNSAYQKYMQNVGTHIRFGQVFNLEPNSIAYTAILAQNGDVSKSNLVLEDGITVQQYVSYINALDKDTFTRYLGALTEKAYSKKGTFLRTSPSGIVEENIHYDDDSNPAQASWRDKSNFTGEGKFKTTSKLGISRAGGTGYEIPDDPATAAALYVILESSMESYNKGSTNGNINPGKIDRDLLEKFSQALSENFLGSLRMTKGLVNTLTAGMTNWIFGDHSNPFEWGGVDSFVNTWGSIATGTTELNPAGSWTDYSVTKIQQDQQARENLFNTFNPLLNDVYYGDMNFSDVKGVGDFYSVEGKGMFDTPMAALNTVINFSALIAEYGLETLAGKGFSKLVGATLGRAISSIGRRIAAAKALKDANSIQDLGLFTEFVSNTPLAGAPKGTYTDKIVDTVTKIADKVDNFNDPNQIYEAFKKSGDDIVDTFGNSGPAKGLSIPGELDDVWSSLLSPKDVYSEGKFALNARGQKLLDALAKAKARQDAVVDALTTAGESGALMTGNIGGLTATQAAALSSVSTNDGNLLTKLLSGFNSATKKFFKKLTNTDFSDLQLSKIITGYNNGVVSTIGGTKMTVSEMAAMLSARSGVEGFIVSAASGAPISEISSLPANVLHTLSRMVNGMTASDGMSVITNGSLKNFLRTLSGDDFKEFVNQVISRNAFNNSIGKAWDAYDTYRAAAELGWEKSGATALSRMFVKDALTDPLRDFKRNIQMPKMDSEGNFHTQSAFEYFTDPGNLAYNLVFSTGHFALQRLKSQFGNTMWGNWSKQAWDSYMAVDKSNGELAKKTFEKATYAQNKALQYADQAWKTGASYEKVLKSSQAAENELKKAMDMTFKTQGWDFYQELGLSHFNKVYKDPTEFWKDMETKHIQPAEAFKLISTTINIKSALNYGVYKKQMGIGVGEFGRLSDGQYIAIFDDLNKILIELGNTNAQKLKDNSFDGVFHDVHQQAIAQMMANNAAGKYGPIIKNFERSLGAYFDVLEARVSEGLANGDIMRARLDYLPVSSMYFQGDYDDMVATHVNAASRGYMLKGNNIIDIAAADPSQEREVVSFGDVIEHFKKGDTSFEIIGRDGKPVTFMLDKRGLNPIDQLTVYTNRFNMHKYLDRLLGSGRENMGEAGAANNYIVLRTDVSNIAKQMYDVSLRNIQGDLFGYDFTDKETGILQHHEGSAEKAIKKALADNLITQEQAKQLQTLGYTTTPLGQVAENKLAAITKQITAIEHADSLISKTQTGVDIPVGGFSELSYQIWGTADRATEAESLWGYAERVAEQIKKAYADGKLSGDETDRYIDIAETVSKYKNKAYAKVKVDDTMMAQLEYMFSADNPNQGRLTSDFVHRTLLQWDVAQRFYRENTKYTKKDQLVPEKYYKSRIRQSIEDQLNSNWSERSQNAQYFNVTKYLSDDNAVFNTGTGTRAFRLANGEMATVSLDGKSVLQVSQELRNLNAQAMEKVKAESAAKQPTKPAPQVFEASTAGHKEFSALNAKFSNGTKIMDIDISGKSIEDVFQNILKGSGKNKTPAADSPIGKATAEAEKKAGRKLTDAEKNAVTQSFLNRLYDIWGEQNPELKAQIEALPEGSKITDKFAKEGHASQAVALQRWVKKADNSKPASQIQRTEVVVAPGANKNASLTKSYAQKIGGVDVLRHADENGMHYGNPFSPLDNTSAQVQTKSIAEAVDDFRKWLRGEAFQDVEPERRQWILDQIDSGALDGKKLVYYTDEVPGKDYYNNGGEKIATYDAKTAPSHADVLAEFINERRGANDVGDSSLPLKKVISGAQTGADTIGLEIAKEFGYQTGGTAPNNFFRETGYDTHTKDSLAAFGVKEIGYKKHLDVADELGLKSYSAFLPRTFENVKNSDATVFFSSDRDSRDAGYFSTKRFAMREKKPFLELSGKDTVEYNAKKLRNWLQENKVETLNIAGNRGSKLGSMDVENILRTAFGGEAQGNVRANNYVNDSELWREFLKQNQDVVNDLKAQSAGKVISFDQEAGYGMTNQSSAISDILRQDYGSNEAFATTTKSSLLESARAEALNLAGVPDGYGGLDILGTHFDTDEISKEINLSRSADDEFEVRTGENEFKKYRTAANDLIYTALGVKIDKNPDGTYVNEPGAQYQRIADAITTRAMTELSDQSWGFNAVEWFRKIDECAGDIDMLKRFVADTIIKKTKNGVRKESLDSFIVSIERDGTLQILSDGLGDLSARVMSGEFDDILPKIKDESGTHQMTREEAAELFRHADEFLTGVKDHSNRAKAMDSKRVDKGDDNQDFEFNENDDLSYTNNSINNEIIDSNDLTGNGNARYFDEKFRKKFLGGYNEKDVDGTLESTAFDKVWTRKEAFDGLNALIKIATALEDEKDGLHKIASELKLKEKHDTRIFVLDSNNNLVKNLNSRVTELYKKYSDEYMDALKKGVEKGTVSEAEFDMAVKTRDAIRNAVDPELKNLELRKDSAAFNVPGGRSALNDKFGQYVYANAFGVEHGDNMLTPYGTNQGRSVSAYNAALMNLSDGSFDPGYTKDFTMSRIDAGLPVRQSLRLIDAFAKLGQINKENGFVEYYEDIATAFDNICIAIGKWGSNSPDAGRFKISTDFQKIDPIVARYKELVKLDPSFANTFKDPIVEKYIETQKAKAEKAGVDYKTPSYLEVYNDKNFKYSLKSRVNSLKDISNVIGSAIQSNKNYYENLSLVTDAVKEITANYKEGQVPTSMYDNFENAFVSFSSDVISPTNMTPSQSKDFLKRQLDGAVKRTKTVASLAISGEVQDDATASAMLDDIRKYNSAVGSEKDKIGKELFEKYTGRKVAGVDDSTAQLFLRSVNPKIDSSLETIRAIGDEISIAKDTSTHNVSKNGVKAVEYTKAEKFAIYNKYEKALDKFTNSLSDFRGRFDSAQAMDVASAKVMSMIDRELGNIKNDLYEPGYRSFRESIAENNTKFIHEYGQEFRSDYAVKLPSGNDAAKIESSLTDAINKINNDSAAKEKYAGYLKSLEDAREEFSTLSSKKINKEVNMGTLKDITERLNSLSKLIGGKKKEASDYEKMLRRGDLKETIGANGSRSYELTENPIAKDLLNRYNSRKATYNTPEERLYRIFSNRLNKAGEAITNLDEHIKNLDNDYKRATDTIKWDSQLTGKKSVVPEQLKRNLASVSDYSKTSIGSSDTFTLESNPDAGEIFIERIYGSSASTDEGSMSYELYNSSGEEIDLDEVTLNKPIKELEFKIYNAEKAGEDTSAMNTQLEEMRNKSQQIKDELVKQIGQHLVDNGDEARVIRSSDLQIGEYEYFLDRAMEKAQSEGIPFDRDAYDKFWQFSKENPVDLDIKVIEGRDGSSRVETTEIVDKDGKPVRTTPEVLAKKMEQALPSLYKQREDAVERRDAARKDGDLSENEPYRAAVEEIKVLDAQIQEFEAAVTGGNLSFPRKEYGGIIRPLFDDYMIAELKPNDVGAGEEIPLDSVKMHPSNDELVDEMTARWAAYTSKYNANEEINKISEAETTTAEKLDALKKKAAEIEKTADSERTTVVDLAKLTKNYDPGEFNKLLQDYTEYQRLRNTTIDENTRIFQPKGRKLTVLGPHETNAGYTNFGVAYKMLGYPYDDEEALKTFKYDVSEDRKYTDEEIKKDRSARRKMKKQLKKNLKSGDIIYKNLDKFELPNDLDYRSRILSINNLKQTQKQIEDLIDLGKDKKTGKRVEYHANPDDILISKDYLNLILRCSREGIGNAGMRDYMKSVGMEFHDWNQFIQEFQLAGGVHTINALSIAQVRGAIFTNPSAMVQYIKLAADFKDDPSVERFFTDNKQLLAQIAAYNNAPELLTSFMASASHQPGLEDGGGLSLALNKVIEGVKDYKAIDRDAGSKYGFMKSFIQTATNAVFSDATFQRVLPVLQAKMLVNYYDQAVKLIQSKIGKNAFTPDEIAQYASQLSYAKLTEFFEPRKMANINMGKNKFSDALARIDDERVRGLYSSITGAHADMTFGEFCRSMFFALGYKNRMVRPIFQGARSIMHKTFGVGEFNDANNFEGLSAKEAIDKLGAQFTYSGARQQIISLAALALGAFATAKLLGLSTPWDDLSFEDENGNFKVPEILTKFQTIGQIWVPNAIDENGNLYVDPTRKAFNIDTMSSMFTIPNTLWRTIDRTFNPNGYYSAPQRGVGLIGQELGINPQGLNNILNWAPLRAIGDELIGSNLLSGYKATWEVLTDSTYFGNNIWEKKYLSDGSINKNYDPGRNIVASFFHILGFDGLLDPNGYNRFVKGYYTDDYVAQDQVGTVSGSGLFQHEYLTGLFKFLDGDPLGGITEGGELPLKFKTFSSAARTDFNTRVKNIIAQNMADYKNKIKNVTDPDTKDAIYADTVKKCADVVAKWSAKYNYVLGKDQKLVPYITRSMMALLAGEYDDRLDYIQNTYWKASDLAQIEASGPSEYWLDDADYEAWIKAGKTPEEFAAEKNKRTNAYYEALDDEYKARKALKDAGFDNEYLAGMTTENLRAEQRQINKEVYYGIMQKLNSKVGEFDNFKEMKSYYEAEINAATTTKAKAKIANQYNKYVQDVIAPYAEKYGAAIVADGYYNGDYLANSIADFIILPADQYYRGKTPRASYLKDLFGVGYKNKENLPSDAEVIEGYTKALTEANKGNSASASSMLDRVIRDIKANRIYCDDKTYNKIVRLKALLSARSK